MSFAVSGPLQAAVFDRLIADADLSAIVGSAIYDTVPSGRVPTIYVRLGDETVTDASDRSGGVALHRFTISVISTLTGFAVVKAAGAAICDALVDAPLTLSRGHLITLRFDRARATRVDDGAVRQIDLRFAARVQDD